MLMLSVISTLGHLLLSEVDQAGVGEYGHRHQHKQQAKLLRILDLT